MFKKILIANRGEIALRVMRTCREMGVRTVAVYSDADRRSVHVRYADEARHIGAAASAESYLSIERVIHAARESGAEAIHPGYGFLSENPEFALACDDAGIVFVGPPAAAMALLGSKTASRQAVRAAGLPVVPGSDRELASFEEASRVANQVGYPVMLKAAAGGGGKGLRRVGSAGELESAWRTARSEALNAFGDDAVYIEKWIERPRHVEIQVLGDAHGVMIHLGERECSLQRRHQKVMEECPSPLADDQLRRRMGETAVSIARLAGYVNAGTVEFLVDRGRSFYFLEVNTRLQVEHPVTEMVTGIDLVREQLKIAAGEPLSFRQEDIAMRGAAIECRVYAEDPANNFFPSPGLITRVRTPSGPGVRDDSGVYEGWTVPLEYDPLLSKLVVWGRDRGEAIARLRRALDEYEVEGIKTNLALFRRLLDDPEVVSGQLDTGLIGRVLEAGRLDQQGSSEAELAAMLAAALEVSRSPIDRTQTQPAAAGSAWKMAGREALLNNWPVRTGARERG